MINFNDKFCLYGFHMLLILLFVHLIGYLMNMYILQVYPGKQVGGLEADMMASNELKSHAFLQVHYQLSFYLMTE